ncbi:hypothetical protein RGQ29_002378 [Quercus rubra]|uniref:Uncharacterized protein n=1 Tax=Quercus rubra TaxID=3512 RepID=A0AAN7EA70_QUERU|nr:hypothetical protein RGQ29_002378 [Quercus rubra]
MYATRSTIKLKPINEYGVAKVLDSGHPNFKTGDLVWVLLDGKSIA